MIRLRVGGSTHDDLIHEERGTLLMGSVEGLVKLGSAGLVRPGLQLGYARLSIDDDPGASADRQPRLSPRRRARRRESCSRYFEAVPFEAAPICRWPSMLAPSSIWMRSARMSPLT